MAYMQKTEAVTKVVDTDAVRVTFYNQTTPEGELDLVAVVDHDGDSRSIRVADVLEDPKPITEALAAIVAACTDDYTPMSEQEIAAKGLPIKIAPVGDLKIG